MAIRIGRKDKTLWGAGTAILGGGAVAAAVMLTPTTAIETAVATSGLATFLPAAEPPLGERARLILAFTAGIAGMALIAALWAITSRLSGRGPSVVRIGYEIGYDDEDEVPSSGASLAESPRRPLFASSDLDGLMPLADKPAAARSEEGLRLPKSPEALDESELGLGKYVRMAPTMDAPVAPRPVASPSVVVEDPSGVLTAARVQPSDYSALSITELVERFERGLAHRRRLIADAVAAKRAAGEKADAEDRGEAAPPTAINPHAKAQRDRKAIDAEVDEALRAALGTLQRMTARAA